ncbi:helix-turn-helix transcriptional regulator [Oceanobacillus sp. FSL W7-1293]|uniref:helix-turn-helix transcriptional regulator n=1 Tax=Oceanobacillus sp. FSL W7-1293 TaxID=2921699 RepID=UPI0030D1F958
MSTNTRLFIARREHQLKQSDVAKKLNISPQTYYRKEKGISEFSQREMIMLAKIFKCTLNELFWEEAKHA